MAKDQSTIHPEASACRGRLGRSGVTRRYATGPARPLLVVLALAASACTAGPETRYAAAEGTSRSACDALRAWKVDGSQARRLITPVVKAGDGDTTYVFNVARHGVRALRATCGNGPYSECDVRVDQPEGRSYSFAELSRFALVDAGDALWMVYRPQATAKPDERVKHRVVKVAERPVSLCNEIGDYSDLM